MIRLHYGPLDSLKHASTWAAMAGPIGVLGTQVDKPYSTACFIACAACGVVAAVLRSPPARGSRLSPWATMGIAAGALALSFALGWHEKALRCEVKEGATLALQQARVVAAQGDVLAVERHSAQTSNEVSRAYQTNLSAIDARYAALADGLRELPSPAGHLPAIPAGAGGDPECPRPAGLPGSGKEKLAALMKQADTNTAQLLACQGWIVRQGGGR